MMVDWIETTLGELCQIKPPKKEAKQKLSDAEMVSFVPMKNLGICTKAIELNENKALGDVSGSYTYFAEDDVLLAKITPCFENGKLGIAKGLTNGVGFGSSEFIVFRSKGTIDPEFLFYLLSQDSFRVSGARIMTGAVGHKRVPKEFIEDHSVKLPPLPEQKRIVAILDEAFAGIDAAVANTEKNLANTRELFESYLNGVFTRKGDGWAEKTLGELCDLLGGFAFKSTDAVDTSNVQLIRMGNLYQNVLDLNRKPSFYPDDFAEKHSRYILSEGDLIISLTGTVDKEDYGFTVEIPATYRILLLNQRIAKFINIREDHIDRRYLLYFLRSKVFLKLLYGSARGVRQANLSSVAMKKLPIVFPELKKQIQLVETFNVLESDVKNLETIYQQKLTALAELKQSILQKAFAGELTAQPETTVAEAVT